MHVWKKIGFAAGLTVAAAVSIAVANPAGADTAAQPGDAVGVGSDTLQNAADFVFDGAPGVPGAFNSFSNSRVDNVFATGDANGRATYDGTCGAIQSTGLGTYCGSVTATQVSNNMTAPNFLPGSVILRAGSKPVIRPDGSGAGVKALIADSSSTGYDGLPTDSIQFARMSRLPSSTEEGLCPTTTASCAGLHVYQAATDNLGIARVTNGFDGPSALSDNELYNIFITCQYTTWNQIPGNSGGSTNTIHPLIPQSGSGTRTFFLNDLAASQGLSTTPSPGSCVRQVQEHDPTGIYADPTPDDAIEPFSQGKIALINSGYFANGAGYSGTGSSQTSGAYTPNFLTLESGATAPDGNANYLSTRGLYFVVRQADVTSTTPFETGSNENFVQALFTDPDSAIQSPAGQAEIRAAGFTPDFVDCHINPSSC